MPDVPHVLIVVFTTVPAVPPSAPGRQGTPASHGVAMQEFSSYAACESARTKLTGSNIVKAFTVPK